MDRRGLLGILTLVVFFAACDYRGGWLGKTPEPEGGTIVLTVPNGSDTWNEGQNYSILWNCNGFGPGDNVDISYSADGGNTWNYISTVSVHNCWFNWTVPFGINSPNCRVRVQQQGGPASDMSDNNFSIVPAGGPTITVTYPNGGESFWAGNNVGITWNSTSVSGNVNINFSDDGGATWAGITTVPVSDGSYNWAVPHQPSTQCVIQVRHTTGSPSDTSDGFFTITAAGNVWYVDVDNAVGPWNGTSWASAFTHPQDALDAASSSDEVWVAEGTYYRRLAPDTVLLAMKDGVHLYGGFAATESARGQRDWVAHPTTLDGQNIVDHVVTGANSATLDGFTVTNGNAAGNGGGIYNDSVANLIVAYCVFANNYAPSFGGGAFNSNCSPSFFRCTFDRNTVGNAGGAMYNSWSSPEVSCCMITGNTGSAIFNDNSSSPNFTNCVFDGNTSGFVGGGAVWNWSDSHPTATCCTFTGNRSEPGAGAIHNQGSGLTMQVTNCIFWDNIGPVEPDIHNDAGSSCTVSYSDISQAGGYTDGGANLGGDPLFNGYGWWDDGGTPADWSDDSWQPGDYHLQGTSLCSNSGDPATTLTEDIEGSPRPSGTGYDMGAYEYQGGAAESITVTYPNGGEVFSVGNNVVITWNHSGLTGNVQVDYCTDGGAGAWTPVGTPPASDLSCNWTVPNDQSTNCLIRIQDTDGWPSDTSDGIFRIESAATITVNSPNGGEVWSEDAQETVTWNYTGNPGNVDVSLSTDGGTSWNALASNVPCDGSETITVPAGAASVNCRVRVSDNSTGTIYDDSDADFQVVAPDIWYVDASVAASGDGMSWGTAFKTIQEAVGPTGAAQANDEVWVVQGTYTNNGGGTATVLEMRDGVRIYGGFDGTEAQRTDRDPVAHVTILDGENAAYHVVVGASNAALDGFTVTRGNANVALNDYAGGMYNNALTDLAIASCTFSGNSAHYSGGMYNVSSSPTVTNCTFSGNSVDLGGGGMGNYGSSPKVMNCTFSGNSAGYGGGMENTASSSPTVANCIFWNDTAPTAPEVRNDSSTPTFSFCDVAGCGGSGGGWVASFGTDGGGNIDADPLFVDGAGGDFHLQEGSLCIDAADGGAAPGFDIEGNPRHDDTGMANTGSGPPWADMGAYEFQGNTAVSITVTSPNGGETWEENTQETVTWTSVGSVGNVRIRLSTDGGASFMYDLGMPTADDGSETITVPSGSQSTTCRVRVQDESTGTIFDDSDGDFTILPPTQTITVTYPNGGESFNPGDNVTITWTYQNVDSWHNVTIEYCTDSSGLWVPVDIVQIDTLSCSWTVPNDPGTQCLVRITDQDGDPSDESDGLFMISFVGNVWYVDVDNVAGPWNGTGWATAFAHPQDALDVAFSGDEIWVAEGTYVKRPADNALITMKDVVSIYGGFDGTESACDQRDPAANVTTLDGEDTAWHVVAAGSSARLDGFTVTHGNANGGGDYQYGGGMFAKNENGLVLANCIFDDNRSNTQGEGIYTAGTLLLLDNCTIENHSNANAVYAEGSGMVTARACTFAGNSRALLCYSSATLVACTFANNTPYTVYISGNATVKECVFTGNSGSDGGALRLGSTGSVVENCVFTGNSASSNGGAAYLDNTTTVTNCTFVNNSANGMGGALCLGSDGTITNCTLTGNSAVNYGGAIYTSWATIPVSNCILWANSAPSGSAVYANTGSFEVGYSCIDQAADFTDLGGNLVSVDPGLADPDNGNCRLQIGSPCIDAADGDDAPQYDIEGSARYDDAATADTGTGTPAYTDMGAYEYQGGTVPVITISSPNGGEVWVPEEVHNITWMTTGTVGTLNIDYSVDGGNNWILISSGEANDGSYTWTLPGEDSVNCLVRVEETDGDPSDVSNAVFSIENSVWKVDVDNAAGPWDGYTWATAFQTVQEAVGPAGAAVSGDEVWVAEGTYTNNGGGTATVLEMQTGVEIYGGFDGTETQRSDRDPAAHVTTLDGENTAYHVVKGVDTSTLDGFTVANGNANGGGPSSYGGGMYNDNNSSPTVTNCTFSGNSVTEKGGGMYIGHNSSPTVTNCWFSGNSANQDGGGMHNEYSSSPTLTNCTFSNNSANGDGGGGMHNYDNSSPTVTSCTFSGNSAAQNGGGMYNHSSSSPTLRNCTFSGNLANRGGGMYNYDNAGPTPTNCTFSGNSATEYGGGMCNWGSSWPPVTNCVFYGNTAGSSGPEVYNNTSTPTFSYCDIAGCGGSGGGWVASFGTDGGGNIDADPLLVDADGPDDIYGTPDDDLHLQGGSPCIDSADGPAAPATDIEGNARTDDSGMPNTGVGPPWADMGAYEFQGATPPGITVTSPDGGEAWYYQGADQDITWTSVAITGNVDIRYSTDNGGSWNPITTVAYDSGPYTWTIPNEDSVQCLVQVREAGGGGVSDQSDAVFPIAPATVTVTVPNGGETWYYQGANQNITWTSAGITGNVDIRYSTDNGGSWNAIVTVAYDSSPYTWTIPNEDSAQCLVEVREAGGGGLSDQSNVVFTIAPASLTVTDPNGGETWTEDAQETVTWTSQGVTGNVQIDLSIDGGTSWMYTLASNTANDGSEVITVPMVGAPCSTCRVRVIETTTWTILDTSDADFTILPPTQTITVTYPNGGESFNVGDNVTITWTYEYITIPDSVRIEYCTDGGAGTWVPVDTVQVDSSPFNWTVPNDPSTQCFVRVTHVNGYATDVSDGVFTMNSTGIVIYVDIDNVAGPWDGNSWATAYQHPQDALDAAAVNCDIWVAEGTYVKRPADNVIVTMKDFVSVYGGFAATESALAERDLASHTTILDGEDTAWHVVTGKSYARLDGFTITRGNANGGGDYNYGGGLFAKNEDSLVVANCIFDDNRSSGNGQAIQGDNSSLVLDNCTIENTSSGDAIDTGGKSLSAYHCTLRNNGRGYYTSSTYSTWVGCTFEGQTDIALWLGEATIRNCIFSGNTSSWNGGAIYGGSTVHIENCLFSDNSATGGSGGAIYFGSAPSKAVRNCTFVGNSATSYGGAVHCEWGTLTVTNCILQGNTAPTGSQVYGNEYEVEVRYSCIDQAADFTDLGGNLISVDPGLADPDNGNYHLQIGSPCIDAADGDDAPQYDIEGSSRYDDAATADTGTGTPAYTDMGAYEYQGGTVPVITITSPNGGEVWDQGSVHDITWTSTGIIGTLNIDYSVDGGTNWISVSSGEADDGSYSWALPAEDSVNCLVRVEETDGDPSDVSNATFTIWSGIWKVDVDNVAGPWTGSSWTTAFRFIQDAVGPAGVAVSGDEVWVAEGTYTNNGGGTATVLEMQAGVEIYGGFNGTETQRSDRDPAAHVTTLDGENTAYHVVEGVDNSTLDGFTITNGNANGGGEANNGGGMYNNGVTNLSVTNCTFMGNSAVVYGGGMFNGNSSSPTLTNCTFSGNSSNNCAGGMYNNNSSPTVVNCTFSGNSSNNDGGGMYNYDNSNPTLTNCTFSGNSAVNSGGGLSNSTNCSPTVTNCIFWNDTAPTGPEVYNSISAPTFNYCDIAGCGGSGGGWIASFGTDGGGNIDADPFLVDADGLDDIYGTPDDDLHLQGGSVCIDSADGPTAPATDIEGNPRYDDPGSPNNGVGPPWADMGAFEYQ